MKYLAHSTDAAYDAATKRWTFDLGRRVPRPTSLVISKACFSVPTGYENPPHVVYMRSDALSRMVRRQHTVELKHESHTAGTNILAVLSETHTRGRYRAYSSQILPVDPNDSPGVIDIYFTDGSTPIEGEFQAGSSSSTTTTPAGEQAVIDINTAGDLHVWLTMESSTCLNVGFVPVTELDVGEINTITNRTTEAPQNVFFGAGTGPFTRTTLGQTHCVFGYNVSWNSALDAVNNPSFPDDSEFAFHHLFRAPGTLGDSYYFQNERGLRLYFKDDYSYNFQTHDNQWGIPTQITWFPNHVYLFTIERRGTTANGDAALYWTVKNLTNGAVMTETTADGYKMHTGGNAVTGYDMRFGAPNTGVQALLGPCIIYLNPTDARKDAVRNYLESLYTGTEVTTENQTEVATNNENAEFFVELQIK